MKNLLIVIKISLFLPLLAFAKPVATVVTVKGNAFTVYEGKTKPIHPGMIINNDSHIITEIGSKVEFVDYYDRYFDFSGGGHARILENQVVLNRGYMWVESFQNKQSLQLRSANSKVNLSRGEVIFSFDSSTGRSQLMCVEGSVTLSNKIDPDFYATLNTGEFSFIDPSVNDGLPRGATKIGYRSFEKLAVLFDRSKDMKRPERNMMAAKRSMNTNNEFSKSIVKTPSYSPNRMPASENEFTNSVKYLQNEFKAEENVENNEANKVDDLRKNLLNSYSDSTQVKSVKKPVAKVKKVRKKSNVKIRTFGVSNSKSYAKKKQKEQHSDKPMTIGEMLKIKNRGPSSVPNFYKNNYKKGGQNQGFINSLEGHYKSQQKHPNEVNGLIRELKNYREDYSPNY